MSTSGPPSTTDHLGGGGVLGYGMVHRNCARYPHDEHNQGTSISFVPRREVGDHRGMYIEGSAYCTHTEYIAEKKKKGFGFKMRKPIWADIFTAEKMADITTRLMIEPYV